MLNTHSDVANMQNPSWWDHGDVIHPSTQDYPQESSVVTGRASVQNCFHAPVKVLPWYLCRHIRALEQGSQRRQIQMSEFQHYAESTGNRTL